jgi:hypothetical protein
MKPQTSSKWFWTTFLGLWIFTVAVVCRALIFSNFRFNPKPIGDFEAELNGSKQKNEVWVNTGRMKDVQAELTKEWINQGWNPVAQGMDFAPTLLGLGNSTDVLSPYLQIKMFEKDENYRTLSLLEDSEQCQTYGWVSETPKNILDLSQARAHWTFPFQPPDQAIRLYCQKSMNFQTAFIFLPSNQEPLKLFQDLCLSQNFEVRSLGQSNGRLSFILAKGNLRLLALLDYRQKENVISLVYFPKK